MPATLDLFTLRADDQALCPDASGQRWLDTRALRRDVGATLKALRASRGARPSPSVAVVAEDRYWMLVACLTAWSDGLNVVLPPNHKPDSIAQVMQRSGSALFFSDVVGMACPGFEGVPLAPAPPDGAPVAACLIERARPLVSFFTSGTTGDHVCSEKTGEQLLGEVDALVATFGFGEQCTIAATVPAHHLYGFLFTLLVPWCSGARFLRPALFHAPSVADAIERHGATDLVTVPAHMRTLLASEVRLGPLSRAFSSGARLDVSIAQAFVRDSARKVIDVLGSTESGGIAWREPALNAAYVPLPGVEVAVAEDSRLKLRSPFAERGGWQLLGDRVRLVPGGFEHLGRSDGVLKVGAKRVTLQELEARARQLEGIDDAAALVQDSSGLRDNELWLVVADPGHRWTSQTLRLALARHFDEVVLPRRYRVVERLPRDALGKLQKQRLVELFASREMVESQALIGEPTLEHTALEDRLRGQLHVPADWIFFQGHFPEAPILPGVAQLTELVLPVVNAAWRDLGSLEKALRVKYKRPIRPGARLSLHAWRQ